ncbi:MAG: YbaB/EbfC family nucleoid-associated protein [Clostridiales bacterium]|nr:YbaB/EbfC family nucleoid-associated protein [Clostridiales bacterium]
MGKGMKAGKKPNPNKGMGGMGGGNMQKQMQQMAAMQRKMEALQEEIDKMETTATSGGGAVTVTVNGTKQIVSIEIKEEVVDPDDIEMLQDLIITAANEALRQMEEISNNEMGKITAGLGIPGL